MASYFSMFLFVCVCAWVRLYVSMYYVCVHLYVCACGTFVIYMYKYDLFGL